MSSLEGVQMGLPSHPRIRSGGKPKPFQRPSITLGGEPVVKRTWRQVRADQVLVGDNVPGIGVVTEVERFGGNDIEGFYFEPVLVRGGAGNMRVFGHGDLIFCFTAARGD